MTIPTLHLLCGKIGAGKSTLAAQLAQAPLTVALAEDALVAALWPGEIRSMADYLDRANRLRGTIAPHVRDLLRQGVSVVMDFQANTVASRRYLLGLLEGTGARHELHWLDVADDVCRQRLRTRNAAGTHEFQASDAEFDRITSHFQAPSAAEGLTIVRHG